MKQNPPKHFLRFFRWYCHPQMQDYIEGDLMEVYERRVKEFGKSKADIRFIIDVLLLFRPAIIRPYEGYERVNNYGMIKNYFKIGWRNLTRRKGFAAINIAGLALSFSCSILIYLFVSYHLQFDDFHKDSDRIYRAVTEQHRDFVDYDASVPPGFANAFKADYQYAEKVAKIVSRQDQLVTINEKEKLKADVAFVENDFFEIFNFPLQNNQAVELTGLNKAFITESAAKKIFGNVDPIGKAFRLENEELMTVIGVLVDFPKTTLFHSELFVSFESIKNYDTFLASERWGGINSNMQCFIKLVPNQKIGEIEDAIAGYVKKFRPNSKNVHHYKMQALGDIHFNPNYNGGINPRILWVFSFIGVFLLIVASINFINISTAQSITRSKEVGMRKVLGSLKNYLFWQFMAEAFIITLMALVLGVIIMAVVLPSFNSIFSLTLSASELLTGNFILFIAILLVGITLISGSYPGIILARISPLLALKGKLTSRDAGGMFTRKVLVVAQFIISIVLIIGTIGINKQIDYAIHSDLGFDKSAMVMVPLPSTLESVKLESLKERIKQFAGVEKITACFAPPNSLNNNWGTSLRFNNNPETEDFSIQAKMADKDYVETFKLKLVAGRNFYEKDTVDEILVNETFAKKVGTNSPEELLGKTLEIDGGFIKSTIVGVVNDFHDRDFHGDISPIFIAPVNRTYNELAIKIDMNVAGKVLSEVGEQWSSVFPEYIFEYEFLDDNVARLYESEQRFLALTKLFSGLAIFIGCLGIYGLILFFVVQKTREIGIRKVLGGSIAHILILVSQDFLKLLLIAAIIASPLAWYLVNKWLQNFNYKTEISWWIFILATGIVAFITLLTISYQALKAAMANPVNSLKSE